MSAIDTRNRPRCNQHLDRKTRAKPWESPALFVAIFCLFTMNQTRRCSNTYSIYNYWLALTSAQRWPISTQNPRVQRRQGYELGGCSRSVLRHMVTIVQLPRPYVLVDCSIGEWMVAHSTAKLVDVFTSSQMLLKVKMAWTRISSACC